MIKRPSVFLICLIGFSAIIAQETVIPGATEKSPSRAQYFSWINNTNEGATEDQTLTNLEFFGWMNREYGMQLDIYAFDAGAIDGKRFYGSIYSDRFKEQFPSGFDPIYKKAKEYGIRLGVWGGPDGFGDTPEEEKARIDQMVKLCSDYEFALFKFDAVCGPLRPEKEDAFIEMMTKCREYSPDLILLNHRLGLNKGKAYATTFLWEGWETYIDVFMSNRMTAPHHRAQAISRGLPPDLVRLTEDHGVCISSCPDYWDDDLVLQAFNRNMILAPEVYGSPWFLRDDEFPKLARIYNLHKKYRDIMVEVMVLPEEKYGPFAVSRGDDHTRIVTLRNLSWKKAFYTMSLSDEIGITRGRNIEVRQMHPTEVILGNYNSDTTIDIEVDPFRSCLLIISSTGIDEPAISGAEFEVIKNIPGEPIEIDVLGWPGTTEVIRLVNAKAYKSAQLNGMNETSLLRGKLLNVNFSGESLTEDILRKVGEFSVMSDPTTVDWKSLYEATVFSTDNNALEVRTLQRSGWSSVPEVKAAQEAFFNQKVFNNRGIWDKNLFDGSMETGFWAQKKYNREQRIKGGCFRLDLGQVTDVDYLIMKVGDIFSLQPLLEDEGNHVDVSTDLVNWETITYMADTEMRIDINGPVRYLRFRAYPSQIREIEGYKNGRALNMDMWRASNLFAHPSRYECHKVWTSTFELDEIAPNSYLCVALNGEHGEEGAYVAAKIDGKLVGAPDRAQSYQSNTWEYVNSRTNRNYTYYIPVTEEMEGKEIDVFVLGFDKENLDFEPEVWINAYPVPYEKVRLILERR